MSAALQDSDSKVRQRAAHALFMLGPEAEPVLGAVTAALHDESAEVRETAASLLRGIGPAARMAIAPLNEALGDADIRVRTSAATALWSLDPSPTTARAIFPVLQEALGNGRALFVREHAIGVLKDMGSLGRPALAQLIALLRDVQSEAHVSEWSERPQIAQALGAMGPDPRSIHALGAVLKDGGPSVRHQAAKSLGEIGQGNEAAVQALIEALQDPDDWVSSQVAGSLWKLTHNSKLVVPFLISALRDEDAHKHGQEALSILGDIGSEAKEASADIRKALGSPYDWARLNAAIALRKIEHRSDPEATRILEEITRDRACSYRVEAARELWVIDARRRGILIGMLTDKEPYVSGKAAEALGEFGPEAKDALPALTRATDHKHLAVRVAAREALKKIQVEPPKSEVPKKALELPRP